jgi:hypothetical protein
MHCGRIQRTKGTCFDVIVCGGELILLLRAARDFLVAVHCCVGSLSNIHMFITVVKSLLTALSLSFPAAAFYYYCKRSTTLTLLVLRAVC